MLTVWSWEAESELLMERSVGRSTESGTASWPPWLSQRAHAGQLWPLELTQLREGLCHEATLWSRRGLGHLYPAVCASRAPQKHSTDGLCPVPVPSASPQGAQAGFPRCFWGVTRGVMIRNRKTAATHTLHILCASQMFDSCTAALPSHCQGAIQLSELKHVQI